MSVEARIVAGDEADIRLDRWFRRHFPGVTQGMVQKLCRTGQIRVDGGRVGADARLAPGQTVRIPPLPEGKAPAPPPVVEVDPRQVKEAERMLLHRDDEILVINKPSGLPTQGGPGITRHLDGMLDAFRFGAAHRPRLVHRLDQGTSGVLLLARSPGVAAKLAAQFRTRAVEKTYWAVVVGRPMPPKGRIELDLIRREGTKGGRVAVALEDDEDKAHAITDYVTLDHAGKKLSWLEMYPLTGRTHQLRVSCAELGTPILGDAPYGQVTEEGNTALVEGFAPVLHLHARRLVLPHPAGGRFSLEAPLPPHLVATFRDVGFSAPAPAKPKRF